MEDKEFVRKYSLLTRRKASIPTPNLFILDDALVDKLEEHTEPMAFDYETSGLKWMEKGYQIRSVSFHNNDISLAIDLCNPKVKESTRKRLLDYIANHKGLIAHNAMFEAGVTFAMTKISPAILCCTRGLAMQLAGEGSPGQSWGLKALARELLGWEDWSKGLDMGNCMGMDWEVLGRYNQIDSAATWELFCMMREIVDQHKDTWGQFFWEYHQQDFLNLVDLQVETYFHGLNIEVESTQLYSQTVGQEILDKKAIFLEHEDIAPGVKAFNDSVIDEFQKGLNLIPKFKKDGKTTVRWKIAIQTLEELKASQNFNINSAKHLCWLFYEYLKIEPPQLTKSGAPSVAAESLERIPIYGELILDYRSSIATFNFLRALLSTQKGGLVRIPIKVPGTITGRCSSGEVE